MSEQSQLLYFAGLFDGEGCVCTALARAESFTLVVSIGMTDRESVKRFADYFGLNVYQYQPRGNRKPIFQARACGQKAGAILARLRPFLLTKKEHALAGIQFAESTSQRRGNARLTAEQEQRRFDAVIRLRALNRRGA